MKTSKVFTSCDILKKPHNQAIIHCVQSTFLGLAWVKHPLPSFPGSIFQMDPGKLASSYPDLSHQDLMGKLHSLFPNECWLLNKLL